MAQAQNAKTIKPAAMKRSLFSGKHSKTIQLTLMALPGALFFILFP